MTWTTPVTRVTGEMITSAIWNSNIVQNLLYLFNQIADIIAGNRTLSVHTINAAQASLDIDNIDQTGGDLYISGFLRPDTDDVALFLRINNLSGASDYGWSVVGSDSGVDAADSEIHVVSGNGATNGVGNAAGEGAAFNICIPAYIDIFANTSKFLTGTVAWRRAADGGVFTASMAGGVLTSVAVSRLTFFFESGNITEGKIRVRRIARQSL